MGAGRRLGEDEIGLGLLFLSSHVVKIAPPLLFELWTSIYR
jgi:hypothetical protein